MSIQPSQILTQCPLCHARYEEKNISLLSAHGKTRLYHCACNSCNRAMLAVILEASGFVSSIGVVTDLQAEDAKRFNESMPISSDECIRIHDVLESQSPVLCKRLMSRQV